MKILKIMVKSGAVFHMPLAGFPDVTHVEVTDMTPAEYHEIPASNESFRRCREMLGEPLSERSA